MCGKFKFNADLNSRSWEKNSPFQTFLSTLTVWVKLNLQHHAVAAAIVENVLRMVESCRAQVDAANLQQLVADKKSALLSQTALRHGADQNPTDPARAADDARNGDPERLALALLVDVDSARDADLWPDEGEESCERPLGELG